MRLVEPVLIEDPDLVLAPPFVRFVERRLAGVTEVLRMRARARARVDVHELLPDELALVSEVLANRPAAMHRDRLEQQGRGTFTYLIAWEEERPVGHVGITWPDDRRPARELEWGAGIAKVHDLEVAPAHRNRGIGRALMHDLEDRVRARGIPEIGLSTGSGEHYAAARHLYESLGYEKEKVFITYHKML